MKRIRKLPNPAMIVAVVALVFALAGTAVGAKKLLGLGAFRDGVKDKTVGVGKLRYVTTMTQADNTATPANPKVVVATCPANFEAIGGGIKAPDGPTIDQVLDSYMTASGWTGHVTTDALPATPSTFTTVVACARSRAITGTPPTG
jgi:hypothetical protein